MNRSPAYGITFSSGPGGRQSTTVLGEGNDPSSENLKSLGKKARLDSKTVARVGAHKKPSGDGRRLRDDTASAEPVSN